MGEGLDLASLYKAMPVILYCAFVWGLNKVALHAKIIIACSRERMCSQDLIELREYKFGLPSFFFFATLGFVLVGRQQIHAMPV